MTSIQQQYENYSLDECELSVMKTPCYYTMTRTCAQIEDLQEFYDAFQRTLELEEATSALNTNLAEWTTQKGNRKVSVRLWILEGKLVYEVNSITGCRGFATNIFNRIQSILNDTTYTPSPFGDYNESEQYTHT